MFRAMDWLLAPFEYELTTWHPLAVHAPVVLVPLGALGACVYAFTGRPRVRAGLLVWFAVPALATWWAMRTGKALYEGVEGTPIVEELIAQHRTTAAWVLRLTIALVLLLAGLSAWRRWRRAGWGVWGCRSAGEPIAASLLRTGGAPGNESGWEPRRGAAG